MAELGAEALLELLAREMVVLCAVVLDLDPAHERGDAPGDGPVQLVQQAVQQAGTVGVAAAGGIVDGRRLDRRDVDAVAAGVDARALAATVFLILILM